MVTSVCKVTKIYKGIVIYVPSSRKMFQCQHQLKCYSLKGWLNELPLVNGIRPVEKKINPLSIISTASSEIQDIRRLHLNIQSYGLNLTCS